MLLPSLVLPILSSASMPAFSAFSFFSRALGFSILFASSRAASSTAKVCPWSKSMICSMISGFFSVPGKNLPISSSSLSWLSSVSSREIWLSYRLRVVNRILQRYFSITSRKSSRPVVTLKLSTISSVSSFKLRRKRLCRLNRASSVSSGRSSAKSISVMFCFKSPT